MKKLALALALGLALIATPALAAESDLPHGGRDPGMICTGTKDGVTYTARVEDLTSPGVQSQKEIEAFDRRLAQVMIDEQYLGVYLPGLEPRNTMPITCTFYP